MGDIGVTYLESTAAVRTASIPPAIYPHAPSSIPADVTGVVQYWVKSLNRALQNNSFGDLSELFHEESYWRDHLCLSYDFHTFYGAAKIETFLRGHPKGSRLKCITIDDSHQHHHPSLKPLDSKGEILGIRSFLKIETDIGTGKGLVNLSQNPNDGSWKSFTLYTCLQELRGHKETIKYNRPLGNKHSESIENGGAPRTPEENDSPCVLVIGAGQAGLATAARLQQLGLSTVIIESNKRVGDNWRNRYHRLVLHDPLWYNHMPYLPFPENWPVFTPQNKLADWLELYVKAMELTVSTSTRVTDSKWNGSSWEVSLLATMEDGTTKAQTLHPKHIVQATGQSGIPKIPQIPGISTFEGTPPLHSSQFQGPSNLNGNGKRAVVIGSGNSAHDIAQDFYEHGYHVTMVQRSATCVDPTQYKEGKGLYTEGGPLVEDADFEKEAEPTAVMKRKQIDVTTNIRKLHTEYFQGLEAVAFKLDWGPDGSGRKLKFLEHGGGYYIDVGASRLIIERKIAMKSGVTPSKVTQDGIMASDNSFIPADEIVFATGYQSMISATANIFGPDMAGQLGEVWGLDEEGELKGVWRQSGHKGFWFAGGNLALCRWYSRLLALQIKAIEAGLWAEGDL
ncbi:hypothetical protein HYALB_00011665 [Hymenoscyphus albidus]|uniref:FAD/NAD(P)-binding domain-containing protein n=1 Tax=Hymenoscyphus albidus TaxID=595503 RepID=A0A9N9QA52_9HELO|nr:hypothetical protein HYALB_00011665 [Hymenoscyphus albidus]